jgi:hypothetical protein
MSKLWGPELAFSEVPGWQGGELEREEKDTVSFDRGGLLSREERMVEETYKT